MTKSKSNKRKRMSNGIDTISTNKAPRCDEGLDGSRQWVPKDEADAGSTFHLSSQLPLPTQHDLLQYVQHLLEDMGQRYGKRWCLQEMEKRQWMEPRSLELQCWVKFVKRHSNLLSPTAPPLQPPQAEMDLFAKVVQIRHLGVHRQALDFSTILEHLQAARKFALLHQDPHAETSISHVIHSLQDVVTEVSARQGELENRSRLQIHEIRVQQAAREQEIRTETDTINRRYLAEAGTKVDALLHDWRHQHAIQADHDDPSFSASSDIDDILIEASLMVP